MKHQLSQLSLLALWSVLTGLNVAGLIAATHLGMALIHMLGCLCGLSLVWDSFRAALYAYREGRTGPRKAM